MNEFSFSTGTILSFLLLCLITSCGSLQGSSCTFNMWRSQTLGCIRVGLRTAWASRRQVRIWQSAASIETLVPNTLPRRMGHLQDSWSPHTTWMHHGAAPLKCHARLRATLSQASYGPKMALLCHPLRNIGEILKMEAVHCFRIYQTTGCYIHSCEKHVTYKCSTLSRIKWYFPQHS